MWKIIPFLFILCLITTQAVVITNENFESGVATGWSNNTVTNGGSNFSYFLGRYVGTGGQYLYKTYTLASGIKTITINFDLYEMDSWDGELFQVYINNSVYNSASLYTNSHYSNYDTPSIATNLNEGTVNLGYGSWADEFFRYTITLTNTDITSLTLGFGSTLDQTVDDESWGVDNIAISATYIPEPSTFILGLMALLAITIYRRK